jgi:hypothetical protein
MKEITLKYLQENTTNRNFDIDKNHLCSKYCEDYKFFSTEYLKVYKENPEGIPGYHFCSKYNVLLNRAMTGGNFSNPVKHCMGAMTINYYNKENPLLIKEQLKKHLNDISDIEIEIEKIIKSKFKDYDYELELGAYLWECEESPIGTCLYNRFHDKSHDNCIFCSEPNERK